jgi:hypothetical protein
MAKPPKVKDTVKVSIPIEVKPAVCRCKPIIVVTFRHQEVVRIDQIHSSNQQCFMPPTQLDIMAYVSRHERISF